jgi:hypothetical protein
MVTPRIVSSLGANFVGMVEDEVRAAQQAEQTLRFLTPPSGADGWDQPQKWKGNPLTDIEGPMNEAFDRQEENRFFTDATTDALSPGAVVDIMASQIQVDSIAIRERAFRRRHLSRCRAAALVSSRVAFHAEATGTFTRGLKGTVQDLLTQAQSSPRGNS